MMGKLSMQAVFISSIVIHAVNGCVKPFDIQFWMYQNMIRTNPTYFIPYLQDFKNKFKELKYINKEGIKIVTREGPSAVQEFIEFLQVQKPLHALQWDDDLSKAALYLAQIQGPTGQTSHTGPYGTSMQDRIETFTEWESTIGENIMYNSMTPLEAVLNLNIDDGVPSRGHRTNMFNEKFYFTGIATDSHKSYTSMTVSTFKGDYSPDPNYVSPRIIIPRNMAEYTYWSSWDEACNDNGDQEEQTTFILSGNLEQQQYDPSVNQNRSEEKSAMALLATVQISVMALLGSALA